MESIFEESCEGWWAGPISFSAATPSVRTSPASSSESLDQTVEEIVSLIKEGRYEHALGKWFLSCSSNKFAHQEHYRVQNEFYFKGQTAAARAVLEKSLNIFHRESQRQQLDRLGLRFLREYTHAIGHISLLDIYVKMGVLGMRSEARPILVAPAHIPNRAYLDYWRRYLPDLITDPIALALIKPWLHFIEDRITPLLDRDGRIEADVDYDGATKQGQIAVEWEEQGYAPLLTLRSEHREQGRCVLAALGVPSDAWFVGLHVREGRHASRAARDAQIESYRLAIDAVIERGGWILRMGDPSMTPLEQREGVIDYAHCPERCDWMDVFLWAESRFFIGTPSGPAWVPPTFGVPCVATNWNGFLAWRWYGRDLCIPKLIWSESQKRYLSFAESLDSSAGVAESADHFQQIGCRPVDNTPEELRDVVVEMMDRLDGSHQDTELDLQLAAELRRVWQPKKFMGNARMGRTFLQNWQHLLKDDRS